jgi:hypothetical protein
MKGMANDAANGDNMDFPKLFDDEMIDELLANKDNSLAPRIRTLEVHVISVSGVVCHSFH